MKEPLLKQKNKGHATLKKILIREYDTRIQMSYNVYLEFWIRLPHLTIVFKRSNDPIFKFIK